MVCGHPNQTKGENLKISTRLTTQHYARKQQLGRPAPSTQQTGYCCTNRLFTGCKRTQPAGEGVSAGSAGSCGESKSKHGSHHSSSRRQQHTKAQTQGLKKKKTDVIAPHSPPCFLESESTTHDTRHPPPSSTRAASPPPAYRHSSSFPDPHAYLHLSLFSNFFTKE